MTGTNFQEQINHKEDDEEAKANIVDDDIIEGDLLVDTIEDHQIDLDEDDTTEVEIAVVDHLKEVLDMEILVMILEDHLETVDILVVETDQILVEVTQVKEDQTALTNEQIQDMLLLDHKEAVIIDKIYINFIYIQKKPDSRQAFCLCI